MVIPILCVLVLPSLFLFPSPPPPSLSLSSASSSLLLALRSLSQRSVPFAVIGSNTVVEVNGRRSRGRTYPWGAVEGV